MAGEATVPTSSMRTLAMGWQRQGWAPQHMSAVLDPHSWRLFCGWEVTKPCRCLRPSVPPHYSLSPHTQRGSWAGEGPASFCSSSGDGQQSSWTKKIHSYRNLNLFLCWHHPQHLPWLWCHTRGSLCLCLESPGLHPLWGILAATTGVSWAARAPVPLRSILKGSTGPSSGWPCWALGDICLSQGWAEQRLWSSRWSLNTLTSHKSWKGKVMSISGITSFITCLLTVLIPLFFPLTPPCRWGWWLWELLLLPYRSGAEHQPPAGALGDNQLAWHIFRWHLCHEKYLSGVGRKARKG